jgi:hypothetical protein
MIAQDKAAIPKEWLSRLDPEWIALWQEHGSSLKRADEVDIATYRENPSAYSFTYPTWSGESIFPAGSY